MKKMINITMNYFDTHGLVHVIHNALSPLLGSY